MEIQRYGNDRLEIILDASSEEGQKEEVNHLDQVVRTWMKKCQSAKSCIVSVGGISENVQPLAEEAVRGLDSKLDLEIEFTAAKGLEDEADESGSDEETATKRSHLKDLIMLAIVDGEFDGEEQQTVLEIGTGLGVSERRVNSLYNECVLNPDQVDSVPAKDPKERLQHLANLCRVMLADGKVVDWESVLIFPLAIKLGFDSDDVAGMLEEMGNGEV